MQCVRKLKNDLPFVLKDRVQSFFFVVFEETRVNLRYLVVAESVGVWANLAGPSDREVTPVVIM